MKLLVFAVVFCLAVTGKAQNCTALANAGNCNFYTQCVHPRFHQCRYPLAYGNKYCRRFTNKRDCFTSAGQTWIDNVKICLMKAILNSNVYNSNGTCSELQTVAFNSHPSCYTDNGFCTDILLNPSNLNSIASKVLDLSDFWNKLAIQQVLQTATTCVKEVVDTFLSIVDNWIQNVVKFVTRQLLRILKKLLGSCDSGLDIVFVLDASGSIGSGNFITMKDFIKKVVSNFEIRADKTRVGVIRYDSSASIVIPLGSINDASKLNNSITNIVYTNGGTATHLALKLLDTAFSNARTSQGVPRVAIVFTDGQSNSPSLTKQAAQAVHSTGIVVYSFGIGGGVNEEELNDIASSSSNVFLISDFSPGQFAAKLLPLQTSACTTPAIVSISKLLKTSLGMGEFRLLQYPFPDEGITLKVDIAFGQIQVHGSFTIRNPTSLTADFSITSNTSYINFFIGSALYQSSIGGLQTSRQRRQIGLPSNTTVNVYLSIEGLQSYNTFVLNTTFGDTSKGSCLALKQSYCGCCKWSLSSRCYNYGCYCDESCHKWNDCCSDIADIGCYSNSYKDTDPVTIINEDN